MSKQKKLLEVQVQIEALVPRARAGGCLYYAAWAKKLLGAQVLAGTAGWRMVDVDDGVTGTHFQYLYTETKDDPDFTLLEVKEDKSGSVDLEIAMPEIHIWNLWCGQYVDLTTKHWPEACKSLAGLDWPGKPPPQVFMGPPSHSNRKFPQWEYIRNTQATALANKLVDHYLKGLD